MSATPFASKPFPTGTTPTGRRVTLCYCGGGDAHEWRPFGGGGRILACFSEAPIRKPATVTVCAAVPSEAEETTP